MYALKKQTIKVNESRHTTKLERGEATYSNIVSQHLFQKLLLWVVTHPLMEAWGSQVDRHQDKLFVARKEYAS